VLFTVQDGLEIPPTAGVHGYVIKRRAASDLIPAITRALAGGALEAASRVTDVTTEDST
jgi:hypothetical protein